MEHIKQITKYIGVDVGYHGSDLLPANREGCVGKRGIDKNYTLPQVIDIAFKMDEKPNIIIKAGSNAKWYLKHFSLDSIEKEIEKQRWRDTSRYTMYVIQWD